MKPVIWLLILWLVIDAFTLGYLIKTDRVFLKFADMVMDDNLKNVVKSGGSTFYVVDVAEMNLGRPDVGVKFYAPIYIRDADLEKAFHWKRTNALMVQEFENLNFQTITAATRANAYFQMKLAETETRKEKQK